MLQLDWAHSNNSIVSRKTPESSPTLPDGFSVGYFRLDTRLAGHLPYTSPLSSCSREIASWRLWPKNNTACDVMIMYCKVQCVENVPVSGGGMEPNLLPREGTEVVNTNSPAQCDASMKLFHYVIIEPPS